MVDVPQWALRSDRNVTVDEVIMRLGLRPHPEGGYYSEIFRSTSVVLTVPAEQRRSALTSIYFLLDSGAHSRWHRLNLADEVWHYYQGSPLELFSLDAEMQHCNRTMLGSLSDGCQPVAVVPAGCWQAAKSTGDYTLVGCSVGPGFEFDDFRFLSDVPDDEAVMRARFADYVALI
jgi:predicted cupin superfamily sugar epimerase